jgi:hypothetical protein
MLALVAAAVLNSRIKAYVDAEKMEQDDRFWVRHGFFATAPPPSVLKPEGFVLFRWYCVCIAIFAANILVLVVF